MRKNFFPLIFILFSFSLAQAQIVPCGGPDKPPCQWCHILVLIRNLLDFLLWKFGPPFIVFLFALFFVIKAFAPLERDVLELLKEMGIKFFIGIFWIYFSYFVLFIFFTIIGVAGWVGSFTKHLFIIYCP